MRFLKQDANEPAVTDPSTGQSVNPLWQYTYNSSGQVTDTTDQYGAVTTSVYDINGNVIDTLYPDGTEVRTVYNSLGQVILQTDRYATNTAINATTGAITFDNTTPAPLATVTLYNSLGQAFSTQEYKNVLVTITADPSAPAGSGIEMAALSGSALTPQLSNFISSTQTWFDDQGRVIETKNAAGLRTGTIYNSDGSVAFTGPLNASAPDGGEVNSTTDAISFQLSDFASFTAYLYNQVDASTGKPWSGMVYNEVIDPDGHYTKTFQDSAGRTVFTVYENTTTGGDGSYTQTIYSVGSQVIPSTALPSGVTSPSELAIPEGGSETVTIIETSSGLAATFDVYDASGNLTDVWQPPVADGLNNGIMTSPHTHYDYDASGNEIDQIDAKGNETTFAYDENGDQVRETLPSPDGTTPGATETSTYDQFGRELTHADFDGNVATYSYFSTYGNGAYDGSVQQIVYAGSGKATQTLTYTYTPLGQQQSVIDASGTTTYTYDAFGNMTQAVTPEGTINYVYDPVTQLLIETWTGTSHSSATTDILYGYDAQGRLASVSQAKINGSTPVAVSGGTLYNAAGNASSTPLPTTLYTYDNNGNLLSVSDPNGGTTSYTYDSQNRLTSETVKNSPGNTIFSENYTIGDNGLRSSVRNIQYSASGSVMSDTTTSWTYDNEGRLLAETSSITGGAQQYQDTYVYDLDNNRISKTHVTSAGTAITTDSYNGDDELISETERLNGSTVYTTTNTYDNNGSLITSATGGQTTAYTYDARNKMIGYSGGGTSATYVYDDAGNRVQETTGGTTTYYLTDTQNPTGYAQPIEQWMSTSDSRSTATLGMTYVLGNGVLAQVTSGGAVSYLLTDGHGSTRALTNSSGIITSNSGVVFNYDAFGTALNFTASSAGTIFLFGGDAVYDPVSGLYMNGDGERDRLGFEFVQMDSIVVTPGDLSNANLYLYVGGNPISGIDPSGHDLIGTLGAIAIQTTLIAAELAPTILPVIQAATIASGITFGESLLVLQLMQTGYLPADGAQYVATIAKYTGIGYVAGLFASDLIDGIASQAPVSSQQFSQDEEVDGEIAPAVLSTSRPVAQNSYINAEKDRDVTRLQQNGAFQIRVDQRQVANDGEEVFQRGINRPDVQGLFTNGKPVYIEYDTSRIELLAHRDRILSNEPGSTVILKWFDSNGNYTIIP